MTQDEIAELERNGSLQLPIENAAPIEILREEVEIINQDIPGWSVANDGALTVALDLEITDDLKREGIAREFVKRIQTYRKDSGFEITDHIHMTIEDKPEIKEAVEQFKNYICSQVLCDKLDWAPSVNGTQLDFEDFALNVLIEKL